VAEAPEASGRGAASMGGLHSFLARAKSDGATG
jgi:hypothetical protein